MKHLSVHDIMRTFEQKNEKKKQCFEKILELCYKRIEKSVSLSKFACLYEIPEFLLGYPLYDLNESVVYMLQQLQKNGFIVRYFFPRVLHISWETQEIKDKNLNDNLMKLALNSAEPLIQPMSISLPMSMGNIPVPPTHIPTLSLEGPLGVSPPTTAMATTHPYRNVSFGNDADGAQKGGGGATRGGRAGGRRAAAKKHKPIAEFKPSGKFILNL